MGRWIVGWTACATLTAGCGPEGADAEGSGSGGSDSASATDAGSTGTGTGADSGGGATGTGGSTTDDSTAGTNNTTSDTGSCVGGAGAFFDVCWTGDLPVGGDCGAVDLLFVMDGSPSMDTRRDAFIAVVGDLLGKLYGAGLDDIRAMVVDMDKRSSLCADTCAQTPNGSCLGLACDQIPGTDTCGGLVGAGLRTDAAGADCGLPTGRAHVDFTVDPSPLAILQCLLDPGLPGDLDERPAEAMLNALNPDSPVAALGCNDGFRRENAMPVVIFLSDEDDDHSPGDPASWGSALADASPGGDPVLLAMLGDPDRVQPICSSDDPDAGGAAPAPRLRELLATTQWGFGPSICSPDYGPIALDMADVIMTACGMWTPQG